MKEFSQILPQNSDNARQYAQNNINNNIKQ